MTTDELVALSRTLTDEAERYRAELDAAQPRTSRSQWQAWDCLRDAAAYLRSAAVHRAVDEATR